MGVDTEQRVGTTVADVWALERVVGEGATALVYEARHATGRLGAMKIMRRALARDAEIGLRFRREAGVARSIRHPNVVSVWGLSETDDGVPLIAMELLEGETLAQQVRRARPSLVAIRAVGLQLLDGVGACHLAGVVHRDLKPENVFVTPDGGVKLIDFGVARAPNSSVTARRLAIGTPQFMAPEAARGDCRDRRIDVFCLGALLRSLVTGQMPREGERVLEVAAREPLRPLELIAPAVPRSLARVLDRACAWNPEHRWPTAATFRTALEEVDEDALGDADQHPTLRVEQPSTLPSTPSALLAMDLAIDGRPTTPEVLSG